MGAVGVVVGMIAGFGLAHLLIGTVAETISSLYLLIRVREITLTPGMLAITATLGMASVIAAAWLPARAGARMDPVRSLTQNAAIEESEEVSPAWFWCGLAGLGLAGVCGYLSLTTGPPWLGFGAAFFVLTGFSLMVPAAIARFSSFFCQLSRSSRVTARNIWSNLAAANLSRALIRNSVTIAALAAAIGMTIGVSVMVFSFRATVAEWLNETLLADLFLAPASNETIGPVSFIPPEAIQFLEAQPGVSAVDTFRALNLPMGEETVALAVIRGTERRLFKFVRGDAAKIMHRFQTEQCVIVSESFSRRHRVGDGDSLELPTPHGVRRFPVAGTFYDYTRDQGVIYLSTAIFVRLWQDDRVHSLAVYLNEDGRGDSVVAKFRERFSDRAFAIYKNADLRSRAFTIFDQTFAVTYVLRVITVVVAIVGIFLSLNILITERSRELGILRAIGAGAGQIRRLLLWESGMIGLLAGIVGLASGVSLAFVLTGVVNRAFFGWTIQLAFPWASLAITPLWVVIVALLSGLFPAWRAGNLILADALRSTE